MDDIKTSIRGCEGREWGCRVSLDLGTLALYTGTGPAANICIDTNRAVISFWVALIPGWDRP